MLSPPVWLFAEPLGSRTQVAASICLVTTADRL